MGANSSERLYNLLVDRGDYTKSFEDFQLQFSNNDSQERLYNFLIDNGDYTKSIDEFTNQFFAAKGDEVDIGPIEIRQVDVEGAKKKTLGLKEL